jgi:hypothetical protein
MHLCARHTARIREYENELSRQAFSLQSLDSMGKIVLEQIAMQLRTLQHCHIYILGTFL